MPTTPTYHPDITLHPDLYIPVGGETVAATRYHPTNHSGPLPVILIATPYRKDDRITFGSWDPSIQYLASHGYEVVVMDLIGTGASTGTKSPFNGTEGEEIATVIDWLADQPWTTDSVGTFGLSYGAWTQYQVAAINPDPHKAMVPVAVVPSVYESSWSGGAFNLLKRATWAAQMQATRALPPSRRDPDGRWADIWHARLDELRSTTPWLFQFLDHDTMDSFWHDRRVPPDRITVPTFAACGYRDVHTGPMVRFFEDIPAPKRLLLGPWRHNMPEQGREAAIDFRRQAVEWYDHYLKDEPTDAPNHPVVTYWTERDGGWTPNGTWRATDRWPTTDTHDTLAFALTPTGLTPAADYRSDPLAREYTPDHTVGMESLERVGSIINPGVDTSADDARSLRFESDPLPAPVELTGTGHARLTIQPTTPDPIVAARLVDVSPTGRATLVTQGYLRASHRTSHETPESLTPGETYTLNIPFTPKSHVFEPGRRIRVAVAAAAFPRALPTDTQGPFTLHSTPDDPSAIVLPGREHPPAGITFGNTRSLAPPDDAIPVRSQFVRPIASEWTTTRSHGPDTATFRTRNEYAIDLPHDATMTWKNQVHATASATDPGATVLRNTTTLTLEYSTEIIRAHTTAHVTRDTQSIHTTVTTDDHRVFDHAWHR